jgi:hypothetical protein
MAVPYLRNVAFIHFLACHPAFPGQDTLRTASVVSTLPPFPVTIMTQSSSVQTKAFTQDKLRLHTTPSTKSGYQMKSIVSRCCTAAAHIIFLFRPLVYLLGLALPSYKLQHQQFP